MTLKTPLWKIVHRKNGNQYAEMLLRCKPHEFVAERARLEQCGSIQLATAELLRGFGDAAPDMGHIIAEMKAQHEAQLEAIKAHLKAHFSALVAVNDDSRQGQDVEGYIDEIWDAIES